MNATMEKRAACVGGEWKDEGDGYFSLRGTSPAGAAAFALIGAYGNGSGQLAYVALPERHPDIDKDYDSLAPDVNGGLTFGAGNVFGWDYGHGFENRTDVAGDIACAIAYFKARAAKAGAALRGETP